MNETNIFQLAKSVLCQLETLKIKHEKIVQLLENQIETTQLLNMINLGIAEGQIILQLDYHLQISEAEKEKLYSEIKRLKEENLWLRDQLRFIQNKYQDSKEMNTLYSTEIQDFRTI